MPLFCCHENVRVWHTLYFLLSSLRYPHHAQNPSDEVYRFVELRVLSNWGHVEYTCLYRFRVHGHISKWNSLISPYQQTFTVLSSLKYIKFSLVVRGLPRADFTLQQLYCCWAVPFLCVSWFAVVCVVYGTFKVFKVKQVIRLRFSQRSKFGNDQVFF